MVARERSAARLQAWRQWCRAELIRTLTQHGASALLMVGRDAAWGTLVEMALDVLPLGGRQRLIHIRSQAVSCSATLAHTSLDRLTRPGESLPGRNFDRGLAEPFEEQPPAARDPGHHRSYWHAKHLGDLGVRELLHVT